MDKQRIFNQVEKNINDLVENNVSWSQPVTQEDIKNVRNNNFDTFKTILPPRDWLPVNMNGVKILCLAGAGGQQAPLLAAMGADVTVLDLSENMLKKDKLVAERENLSLRIEHGNMTDLSRFSDNSFDIVINPPSLFYVPDILPVFKECYRVLKSRGILIMTAANPVNYLCDYNEKTDEYIACNKIPYVSYEHDNQGDWIEYGHSLDSYIGGQIKCGFSINGFFEDSFEEPYELNSTFTTKAVKS